MTNNRLTVIGPRRQVVRAARPKGGCTTAETAKFQALP